MPQFTYERSALYRQTVAADTKQEADETLTVAGWGAGDDPPLLDDTELVAIDGLDPEEWRRRNAPPDRLRLAVLWADHRWTVDVSAVSPAQDIGALLLEAERRLQQTRPTVRLVSVLRLFSGPPERDPYQDTPDTTE